MWKENNSQDALLSRFPRWAPVLSVSGDPQETVQSKLQSCPTQEEGEQSYLPGESCQPGVEDFLGAVTFLAHPHSG